MSLRSWQEQADLDLLTKEGEGRQKTPVFDWLEHYYDKGVRHLKRVHNERQRESMN